MSIKDLIFLPAVYLSVAFSANVYATNLFVPAYFHPSNSSTLDYWGGLAAAAQIVTTTAILNPDNGFEQTLTLAMLRLLIRFMQLEER